jgi:Cu-Zn family superoxide dismutase
MVLASAVCIFRTPEVIGDVLFYQRKNGVVIQSTFTKLPPGKHGYHIHKAGDLRGEGCVLACDHFHKGPASEHGGPPTSEGPRHTGDLGNLELKGKVLQVEHFLRGLTVEELYGRSLIVHADPDDLGKGTEEDSKTTGHSGKRIACSLIGRTAESCQGKTRKNKKST